MKKQTKKQMAEQTAGGPEAEEVAMKAAHAAAFSATRAFLQRQWEAQGLGTSGVVVVPKDWAEGPEQDRLRGLDSLLTSGPAFAVTIQIGKTKQPMALLNSEDQTLTFRQFIERHQRRLVALAVL